MNNIHPLHQVLVPPIPSTLDSAMIKPPPEPFVKPTEKTKMKRAAQSVFLKAASTSLIHSQVNRRARLNTWSHPTASRLKSKAARANTISCRREYYFAIIKSDLPF
jgi:hypothetical protein